MPGRRQELFFLLPNTLMLVAERVQGPGLSIKEKMFPGIKIQPMLMIISAEPQEITTVPTITRKITGQLIMLRDMRVQEKSSGRGEQLPVELFGKIFLQMKMVSTLKSRQEDFSLRATPGFSSPILSRNGMSGGIH